MKMTLTVQGDHGATAMKVTLLGDCFVCVFSLASVRPESQTTLQLISDRYGGLRRI